MIIKLIELPISLDSSNCILINSVHFIIRGQWNDYDGSERVLNGKWVNESVLESLICGFM